MSEGSVPSAIDFDLAASSSKLWALTLRQRRVLIGTVVFLAALGTLVLVLKASAIATHSLSTYDTVDLLIILAIVIGGISATVPVIVKLRRGATALRIDSGGVKLTYPDHPGAYLMWSDPEIAFDLIDLSAVNESIRRIPDQPYSISVRGVRSLLTDEAYLAILDQVRGHGLISTSQRGSRLLYSGVGRPLIHHVSAPGSGSSQLRGARNNTAA